MAKNARVKITAEDKTKKAIQSAKNNFNSLKESADKVSIAIASLAGAVGFGALLKSQAEFMRINSRMADQLGITTESLTRLQYAITQTTEVTGEQFNEMLQEFNVRMGDAEKGTGPLIDAFSELGLNFDEINKLNTDQALYRVVDAMQQLGDKARVAFLAEELFAGEAAKATPIFIKGAEALKELGDQGERLGLVFSDEEAQKIRDAEKAIEDLGKQVEGLGRDIAIFLADSGKDFVKFLTDVISNIREMPQNISDMFDFGQANSELRQINQQIEKYIQYLNQGFAVDRRGRKEFLSEEDKNKIRDHITFLQEKQDEIRTYQNQIYDFGPIEPEVTTGKNENAPTGLSMDAWENDGFDQMVKDRQAYMIEQATFGAERFVEIWGGAFEMFEQGVGDAFASAIVEQESLGDALQMTMRQVAKSIISTLVQMGVQQLTNILLVKGIQSAANTALVNELGAIYAAAAPAAIATNIATAGAAGISAGLTGMTAAMQMKSAMLLGQFHDGIDYVPKTGSYLLEKGERVIPAKENKQGMITGPTVNISISAIDTQSGSEFLLQNEGRIVEMIQRAYDTRGKSGGPTR